MDHVTISITDADVNIIDENCNIQKAICRGKVAYTEGRNTLKV